MLAVILAAVVAFAGVFHPVPGDHPAEFNIGGYLPDGSTTPSPVYVPGQLDGPGAHRPTADIVVRRKVDGACMVVLDSPHHYFVIDRFIALAGETHEEVVLPWQFDLDASAGLDVTKQYTLALVCGDADDEGHVPHWSAFYRVSVLPVSGKRA